ncbi:MAG: alpha/beta hydrolase [Tagaea sp.]|nr:alpha/beta hydrolase [Tagaea sp.]
MKVDPLPQARQAAHDANYNLRARWPEHGKFMADWTAMGEAAAKAPGWTLDIPYGPGPSQNLDLLAPARKAARRAPLFAFIHGGYWKALDKRDVRFLGAPFAARGIAFASLNYALAPLVSIEAIVRQIRAALDFLWREAPRHGIDPDRIFVGGHSAGGHLCSIVCAANQPLAFAPAGAFSVSGVYDLEPLAQSLHQTELKLDRRQVETYSPLRQAPKPGTRIWATVGGDETPAFLAQQAEFARSWTRQGAKVTVVPAPGLHHFDILAKVADFDHPIGRAALKMIEA